MLVPFSKSGARARDLLASPTARLFAGFLAAVAIVHLWIYFSYESSPLGSVGEGWESWWDQSQYLKSARALAAGSFRPSDHWYPLGYSMLAAPFAFIGMRDPFLIPNLLLTLAYAGAFVQFFRPHIGATLAISVFFGTMLFPWSVQIPHVVPNLPWLQFVIPWNTVPVASIFMAALLVVRSARKDPAVWRDLVLGSLAGFVLITRPVDMIPLVPLGLVYFVQRLKDGRWRNVFFAGAAFACVSLAGLALTLLIYGGFSTPYSVNIAGIGLAPHYLMERSFAIFVDAGLTWGQTNTPLFALFPWMIIAAPLAFYGAMRRPRELWPACAMVLASVLTYMSFNDFTPLNILKFMLIHYIAWAIPLVGGIGCFGACLLLRDRRASHAIGAAAAILVALFVSSLRANPASVWARLESSATQDGAREDRLIFESRKRINAIDIPGGNPNPEIVEGNPYQVMADGEPLAALSDYREIRSADHTRIIFNRPVDVLSLSIVLDPAKTATIPRSAKIRAVRFEPRLDWPWVRRN